MKALAIKSGKVLLLSVMMFLAAGVKAQEYYEPELLLVSQPTINYYYDSDGSLNAYVYFDLENIGSYEYKGRFYLYFDPSAFWLEKVSRYIKVKPGRIKRVTMTIPVYNLNYGVEYMLLPMYKYNNELYPLSMYEDFEMLTVSKIPNYSYRYIVRSAPARVTYYHYDYRYARPNYFVFDYDNRIVWHNDSYYYHERYGYVPPRYHHNRPYPGDHHGEPGPGHHPGDNHGAPSNHDKDGLHVVGGTHSTPMSNKGVNTSNSSSSSKMSVVKPNNGSTGSSNNGSSNRSSNRNGSSNASSSSSSHNSNVGTSSSSSRGSSATTSSSSSSKPRSSATTSSSSSRSSRNSATTSSSSSSSRSGNSSASSSSRNSSNSSATSLSSSRSSSNSNTSSSSRNSSSTSSRSSR